MSSGLAADDERGDPSDAIDIDILGMTADALSSERQAAAFAEKASRLGARDSIEIEARAP